ncbi:MAG: 50S ribosomal protein L4 [Planctomycetota bacterium]
MRALSLVGGPAAKSGGNRRRAGNGEDSETFRRLAQEGVRTEDTMNVPVYNMLGAEVGQMPIDEGSLSASLVDRGINASLIKQAYVMYHANRRQGSARTKSRNAISGSNKKMYKQKGTGNARHSTNKVAQFRGGGRAFAKTATREDYHQSMPVKMRRKANRNALLAKILGSEKFGSEIRVIDDLSMQAPKTKDFVAFLGSLKLDRSALVVLSDDGEKSEAVRKSARNVADVELIPASQMTAFEMLNHRYLVIGKSELEAWLAGPSSQTGKSAKTDPMGRHEPKPRRQSAPRGKKVRGAGAAAQAESKSGEAS